LLTWPSGPAAAVEETRNGYHVESWSSDGMTYWAVSDLNEGELREFVRLFRQN
jgi:hypothetical protein